MICHAAKTYGVTAHGDHAEPGAARLRAGEDRGGSGLQDRVTVELKEYGAVEGEYDKIASIGMFEHVGLDNHDAYFAKMHALLRPRGLYLHQATTRMATRDLKRFRKRTAYQDVITRFIFPGGELDYVGLTATNLERHGFEVHRRGDLARALPAHAGALGGAALRPARGGRSARSGRRGRGCGCSTSPCSRWPSSATR